MPVQRQKLRRYRNFHGRLIPIDDVVPPPSKAAVRIPPEIVQPVSAAARIELAARKAMAMPRDVAVPGVPVSVKNGKAATIAQRDTNEREGVISKVIALLMRLGHGCPRGRELLDNTKLTFRVGMRDVFVDMACGVRTAGRLRMLVKESNGFLDWLEALEAVPFEETEKGRSSLWTCAYLREVRGRGKTVPSSVRQAICWLGDTFAVQLHANASECVRTVESVSAGKASAAVPAAMMPIEVAKALENMATSHPDIVIRVFSGLCAACVTGVKRWSDIQRVSKVEDAEDCVIFTSWKSKGKRIPYTWCVPKLGLSGIKWVHSWVQSLNEAGCRGEDYLVRRPCTDFQGFSEAPAR